jgi:hypothetical protein
MVFIFFSLFSMIKPLPSLAAASVAVGALLAAAPAFANAPSTAPGKNKIVCFQSGDATCTLNSKGAKGSATLTVTGAGDASLYYEGYNGSVYGALLSDIDRLSFTYTGTPTAGSPRFSIPIDENDDGLTEAFAFVGANLCNDGYGLVDVIHDATCDVNYQGVDYANWAAFVAAYPDAKVALTDNYLFVIADDVGTWTVNNVTIGKPGK